MNEMSRKKSILIAEDDPDDQYFLRTAIDSVADHVELVFASNGREAIDYLDQQAGSSGRPLPHVILLDLNMPVMDGLQTLRALKQSEALSFIPVVVYSTSRSEMDIKESYSLGANSFIVKPVAFAEIVKIMKMLCDYWLDTVEVIRY